jgi:ssDNA-binding Zn-finger/Zn-ribbon topoisomerase 1
MIEEENRMTKDELEKPLELRGICPKCGYDELTLYLDPSAKVRRSSGHGTKMSGSKEDESPDDLLCPECGHTLELHAGEGGTEWLIAHCAQEAPDPEGHEYCGPDVPPSGGED